MERIKKQKMSLRLRVYVSVMLLSLWVFSAWSLPVISEISLIGGERGIAASFIADSPVSATFKGTSSKVVAQFTGCVYGLSDFNYTEFPASSPIRSISAREKKGSIVEITFEMKNNVKAPVKSVQKNGRWIALLSELPVQSFAWNSASQPKQSAVVQKSPPSQPKAASVKPAAIPQPAQNVQTPSSSREAVLQNVRLLERGHIAELAFEFNTVVKSSIKREGSKVTVSIENVRNGIGKNSLRLPGNTAFKSVSFKNGKNAGTAFLDAQVIFDTLETESNFNIAFTQGTKVSLYLMNREKQKASLWTSGQGQELDYQFYDVPSYKTDMQSIKKRAQRDAGRKLSPEKTFALKEAPKSKITKNAAVTDTPPVSDVVAMPSSPKVEPPAPPQEPKTMAITSNVVNFRTRPTTRSSVLGKLFRGEEVIVLETSGKWCKVETGKGTGYIYASLLGEPKSKPASEETMIADAQPSSVKTPAPAAVPATPPKTQQPSPIRKVATTPPQNPSASIVDIPPQQLLQQTTQNGASPGMPETRKRVIRYTGKGRDPFEPILSETVSDKGLPFVENLNLVGVLIDDNDRIALCEDKGNDDKPFAFREFDKVEKGKVLKIYQDKVVFLITEYGISRSYTLQLSKLTEGNKKEVSKR